MAMVLAAGIGYLKYVNAVGAASEQAAMQSVKVAKDSTVAMLSYTPDTVDQKLTAATDRMTGNFRESYSSMIHDVVIPGAKEKKISAVATVPATASTSATPDHAVVQVFVDQAITMGDDTPTQTNSIVQVTLDRVHDRWLISGFDPK
jgi:Mce-associated membrane protein